MQTERPTQAAAITVNSTCSLADAITAANTDTATGGCPAGSGADTITLTGNVTLGAALPEISSDIIINGNNNSIIGPGRQAQLTSMFKINAETTVTLNDISFEGLIACCSVISNQGDLTINNSFFTRNDTVSPGAAIYQREGSLTINNSTFANNIAENPGVGDAESGVVIDATDSTVQINGSNFINNRHIGNRTRADYVIAIEHSTVTIVNSNFSGNSAGILSRYNLLSLRHVTISGNGNVGVEGRHNSVTSILNSIIFGNGTSDCDGTLTINSNNIIGTGTCGTAYSTADPLLGSWVPPADGNPGYIPLQAGSPAIDAVSCITGITTDIRGTSRPQGSNCDIGAYEYGSGSPPPTPAPATAITVNSSCTLANAITAANTDTATGGCPAGSGGADTITLTANITLSAALPVIVSDITIAGGGYSISGDDTVIIFYIRGGNVSISNLTLMNGDGFKRTSGTSGTFGSWGGAILIVGGNLTIENSTFRDNSPTYIFRGLYSDHTRRGDGGAIYASGGKVAINNSIFVNNSAREGGAITNGGSFLTIQNSSFINNSAPYGGGALFQEGGFARTDVINSTFNSADDSIAAGRGGAWNLTHITAYGRLTTGRLAHIHNSIILSCENESDWNKLGSKSGNIVRGSCGDGTAYSTADPLLGSWVSPADGSPGYFPLQAGSPAIDAVSCITGITTDIRGTSRPQGSNCDIGAYEYDSGNPPPTVDPNITPTTPPTVDPNITPTTAPTATDTPDDEVVLIEFGDFKLTLQDFLDIGTYHPGILPEDQMKLDELISNFNIDWGTAGGAFWNAGVALTKWLGSQFMCGAIKTLGKLAVRVGVFTVTQVGGRAILTASAQTLKILLQGTSIATSIPVSVPKGATIGGLWGSTFAGVGAVIGAPAGGITLSAVGGWFAHQIALSIAVDILTQSLTTLQGIRQKQAMTDAVAQAIHETEGGTYESAHAIALTIVNAAEFEREFHSLVSYWQFQGGDATPSLTSNVGVGFSNLFANVGGVVLSELLFKKLYNSLLSTALGRQSELDCSNVATIDNLETEFTNAAQAFGVDELLEMGKIVALNYADDLYHFLTVTIRTKLEQLSNLADTIASATSIDPPLMVKSVCQFHGILPVFGAAGDLVCNPIVQPGLVRAICLVPLPTIMIGTRTFGRGSCDDLSSIIPEKTRAQISEKFKVIWDAVPGATNYLISWRLFSSPAGPWREIIVPGNVTSYQLTTRELPRSASGFQLRVQTVKDDIASEPVLYPANPNDPTQFAAAPAIIVHENVPAPPADDSDDRDDRDDSVAAAFSTPQAEPRASTCENLPPHLSVQHYHHSTQCNVLSRASVGHPDLVDNFIAGVDIWGYVGAVVEVCIQGSGPLRFVDTSEMPRSVRPLPAFSDGGLTCAWLERVGQVILVPGPPSPPKLKPATPGPATQALSNCMVTLEYILNFRQGPGGPIRKTADGSDFWLPALVSLTALERTADWFYVDYHGERGWISADFVIERGDCQADAATLPTALPAWEPSPLPANPTAPAPDVTPVGMR